MRESFLLTDVMEKFMFKVGDIYKTFEVVNLFDVKDYHSVAVHIRHRKTGLEIVHFVNDDDENLFTFAFRTPNVKSNGAAHILEHSVLCGSERFPLKDPFVALSNQSVKTYLNALTFPDRTVYPASSIVKNDYFNLFNVYGDAVFFPRLDKEIFLQEAHRLEIDENGNPSIQGVVYNEMKGDYSSFDSAVSNFCNESLLRDSVYEKDSGGDPLEIPSLTYEEFKKFHEKWYRPDNCLIFLYGNIPTEEQLDFIQSNFLERLEKKFSGIDYSSLSADEYEQKRKVRIDEFLKYVTPSEINAPVEFYGEGPGDSEDGNSVIVNWIFDKSDTADSQSENSVLSGILLNHDGSPLHKALLDSRLGEDLSPQVGFSSYLYNSVFSVGLRGVKNGDEKKVEKVIFDTLKKIAADGISERDIESTLMSMEFAQREIKRFGGPYSRSLMSKIVYGWLYGFDISRQIRQRDTLEKIKAKIKDNPKFFDEKIKRLLLENNKRSLVVVTPSKKYTERRNEAEKKNIERLFSETTVEKIKSDNEALHEFQKTVDDVSCLPHLNPNDFIVDGKPMMNRIKTEIGKLDGVDSCSTGRTIPLFKNVEGTNGIIYMTVAFPVDGIDVCDYPYVPALTDALDDSGWVRRSDGKFIDWAESSELCALHTGGLTCTPLGVEESVTETGKKLRSECNWIGRDWIVYKIAMLEEETENALEILADCITGADFRDKDRLLDIFLEDKNDFESSVVPEGHFFADTRAKMLASHAAAIDELWSGISQLYTLRKVVDCDKNVLAERFSRMVSKIKDGGSFIQVTAEESGMEKIIPLLPSFVSAANLKGLSDYKEVDETELRKLTALPVHADDAKDDEKIDLSDFDDINEEVLVLDSQVGFASEYFSSYPYGTEGEAISDVCAHWLSNNLLWERVRTIGGAYGAFCSSSANPGGMSFTTYRDPKPFSSCDVFEQCLAEVSELDFSTESVEKAIVGDYSHWVQPQAPKDKGATGLVRTLAGISDSDRENKLLWLMNATPSKIRQTFRNLLEKMNGDDKKRRVIICGKDSVINADEKRNRKIIYLPI